MPHTIAIAHHAGGVGKTTTALNLGYSLAAAGAPVLLVDLDPQSDLTARLGVLQNTRTLAGALRAGTYPAPVPLRWDAPTRVDLALVPSDIEEMADIELQLAGTQMREQKLRRALSASADHPAYILLDCPPSLNLLTVNALYAADTLLVPVQAQDKALRQLTPLFKLLAEVQSYREGRPLLLGFLLTMADGTLQSRNAEQTLRSSYGTQVFSTTIPRRTQTADDGRYHAPIGVYAPDSPVALAYAALAQEVQSRATV